MPRTSLLRKSITNVCIDSVLFFAMFAVMGHLTINFWERYTIQNELSTMKNSLHSLKDTITNIGKAYDNLQNELKDLFSVADKRPAKIAPQTIHRKDATIARCKNKYNIDHTDHRILKDLQVQTVVTQPNRSKVGVGVVTDKAMGCRRENKTRPILKNATTNTRNPPKSIGITSDISNYERYCLKNDSRLYSLSKIKCLKDIERCRHCSHSKNRTNQ